MNTIKDTGVIDGGTVLIAGPRDELLDKPIAGEKVCLEPYNRKESVI